MIFENARWICEKNKCEAPIFRKRFAASDVVSAQLNICGLGVFEAYCNAQPVSEDVFSPALSTYSQLNGRNLTYPLTDVFHSPRVYYCHYDLTDLIHDGENVLAVMLGNGWFNQHERRAEGDWSWGHPRLIFELQLTQKDGTQRKIASDTEVLTHESHILRNNLFYGEEQDLSKKKNVFDLHFDDTVWGKADICEGPEGEMTLQTCPPDRIVRRIRPKYIKTIGTKKLYDVGENISGYVSFSTDFAGMIRLEFAEEITHDGLDPTSAGSEVADVFYADGCEHSEIHPHFTWHGFRYFTVEGEIKDPICCVIHTVLERNSAFSCDQPVLNWLDDAYCRTQQMNIHGAIPLDCPCRERLGYTGDGQLCAQSCMTIFNAKEIYRKWMTDIIDCQGENGHVQHTAPFLGGGGGPAGWGGAIVVVPYVYYWQYGETEDVRRWYPYILKYFEYMESRCENGLVVREEDGGWCLGDWVIPDISSMSFSPEYVNTCLLVKFYEYLGELERALQVPSTVSQEIIDGHVTAIRKAFCNDGNYLENRHGANAFADDIGLADTQMMQNTADFYEQIGCFDTGIFGTEILLRRLFVNGFDDTAIRLLISEAPKHSFGHMMRSDATTLWEGFSAEGSHSHPMYGACVKLLYQYILGIRATEPGYRKFLVSPTRSKLLRCFEGHITTPMGKISVQVSRQEKTQITVTVFNGADGELRYGNEIRKLHDGVNVFTIDE